MRLRRLLLIALLTPVALLALPAPGASAHPLGNFTVNRYAGIQVAPGEVRVTYVLDLAEIPTLQELATIDTNGNGQAGDDELGSWARTEAAQIGSNLALTFGGRSVRLQVRDVAASTAPGQGGLNVLRLEALFTGPVQAQGQLAFADGNADDARIGWHEVTATGVDGVVLDEASVPSTSVSDELRSYPNDMLASPLDVRVAQVDFHGGDGVAITPATLADDGASTAPTTRPGTEGGFGGVLANRGLPLIALGLLIAVILGAWHALLPGHGKTIMAAAMVGSGAGVRQAMTVAVSVALMHTASVLALGLAVLGLERTFRPEVLYPWLGVLSGVAAAAIGGWLLYQRGGAWRHERSHADADSEHHHGGHEHRHAHPHEVPTGRRGLLAIALAGGILPAPSALLVMLAAIQAHRAAYGVGLVLAFSVGLAGSLLGVGAGAMRARDVLARRLSARAGIVVPIASAAAILVVGAGLALKSLAAVG